MGIFDRLLRRNPSRTLEPNAVPVKEFLDLIERLPADDPRAAVKQINRQVATVGNSLIADGPLKTRFGDLTLKVIAAELRRRQLRRPTLRYRDLPACKIISAENASGILALIAGIRDSGTELVYLTFPTFYGPEGSTPHYALLEIEARLEFTVEKKLLAVFLDEANFIARRDFLLEILSGLPLDRPVVNLTDDFFEAAEKIAGVIFDDRFVSAHGYPLHQLRRDA